MWFFLDAFWRTGLFASILFGLYQFYDKGWETSWLTVALVGFFAGGAAGLIAYERSRKFTEDRPLTADEILIEEGVAGYQEKSGWFYLTNTRFFYVLPGEKLTIQPQLNPIDGSFSIPLSEIVSAETKYALGIIPKRLILNLKSGTREEFVVDNVKHLSKQITKASGLLLKAPRS